MSILNKIKQFIFGSKDVVYPHNASSMYVLHPDGVPGPTPPGFIHPNDVPIKHDTTGASVKPLPAKKRTFKPRKPRAPKVFDEKRE